CQPYFSYSYRSEGENKLAFSIRHLHTVGFLFDLKQLLGK
ncbi:unnamed protein product, partial [marine sediment metagenome]